MTKIWVEFNARVAIGIHDSVAVMELAEKEVTFDGELVENGCDFAVRNDIEQISAQEWFDYLDIEGLEKVKGQPKVEVGVYEITGMASFDEDSVDYVDVKIKNRLAQPY